METRRVAAESGAQEGHYPPQPRVPSSLAIKDGTILRRETETCLGLFAQCLLIENLSNTRFLWFEDCQARFRWWAFGVKASSTGRGSLDRILIHRSDVRDAIHGVLQSLASALNSCLAGPRPLDSEDDAGDARSDASSPVSEWSAFSEASTDSDVDGGGDMADVAAHHAYFIEMCLRSLMRFSILIRKAKDKLRHKRADDDLARIQRHEPETYAEFKAHLETLILLGPYEHSLLSRLESAEAHQEIPQSVGIVIRAWLFNRLGPVQARLVQANLIRRHRIMYSRKDRRPVGSISNQDDLVSVQTAVPLRTGPSSSQPRPDTRPTEVVEAVVVSLTPRPHALPTTPTSQSETVLGSELGTVPLRSTKATSVLSKLTRTGQNQDYPKTSVLDTLSQCPYCGFFLGPEYAKNEKKWHGHIAHDLSPYICIFSECNSPYSLYTTKEQWLAHMTVHHSVARWFCSTCSLDQDNNGESIFATESEYQSHMLEHHSRAFGPSDLPLLTELAEQQTIEPISCPLCINDHSLALVEYDDHIAKHLHSFSLRALPWDFDLDEAAASAGSSDSAPSPGPQALQQEDHDEDLKVNVKSLQETAWKVSTTLHQLIQHADHNERLNGLTKTERLQIAELLVSIGAWATGPEDWGTTSQQQTCALLLGRLLDSFQMLATDSALDAVQMSHFRTNIVPDLEAMEACIRQRPREDHDIWQDSFRSLSAETQRRLQTIIDDADVGSLPPFGQLNTLLNLSWELEKSCSRAVLTREHEMAQDIVISVQLLSNDESMYAQSLTNIPWVVLLGAAKVAFTLTVSDTTPLPAHDALLLANTLWVLQTTFRALNRGRLSCLAYTVKNTPEDAVAALHFTLSSLYGTLLKLLADSVDPDKSELHEEATARAIARPKTAPGLIGRLYSLVGQLESEVETCRQAKMGTVDENVLLLLEDLPPVFPIVAEAEAGSTAQSEDELSDADGDGDGDGDGPDLTDFAWIPPLPFDEVHARIRERRVPGTCERLLSREDFNSWVDSIVPATFLLTGSFGTGKTFLASAVIDHVRDRIAAAFLPEGLAFFYCGELDPKDCQTSTPLLLSLVRQLLAFNTHSFETETKIAQLWDATEPKRTQLAKDLFIEQLYDTCFLSFAVTIVLDGLDNLTPSALSDLAATLGPVLKANRLSLRLFLSSRSNRDVSHLASFAALTYQGSLQHWGPHDSLDSGKARPQGFFDMEKMVMQEWNQIPPGVRDGVVLASEGSFLWALVQTRRLRELGADTVTESTIRELPTPDEMIQTFEKAADDLSKLDDNDRALAMRALRLVLCAGERVLPCDELLSALCIDPETEELRLTPDIRKAQLQYLCPDLLILDWDAELGLVWRLTHGSCAAFFEPEKPQGHLDAARIHLRLLLEGSQEPSPESPSHSDPIFDPDHALQISACHHWALHVRAYQDSTDNPDPVLVRLLKRFLGSPDNSSQHYQRWYGKVARDDLPRPPSTAFPWFVVKFIAPKTQTLFTMCQFSMFGLLRDWWTDPTLDLSARNGGGQTLLQVVNMDDPESFGIGRRLVELGVDVRQTLRGRRTSALAEAVFLGNAHWVQFIIARGADVDLGSPLGWAVRMDRPDLARILLEAGARVDAEEDDLGYGSVLAVAAASAGLEMVDLLLDAGAVAGKRLSKGVVSALAAAGRNQRQDVQDIVALLVRHGANVNLVGGIHGSALGEACANRNLPCLESLIQAGVDLNQQLESSYGGSALAIVVRLRDLPCVEALIKAGADVNQTLEAGPYGSSLAVAARYGELPCLQALLAAGADPNQELSTGRYGSALVAAAETGSDVCIRALLEAGADPNRPSPNHEKRLGSALAVAVGKQECMRLLIDAGADVNQLQPPRSARGEGGSALAIAAEFGRLDYLRTLLDAGADVNLLHRSEELWCGSALVAAVRAGSTPCVRALIAAGARVDQQVLVGVYGNALTAAAGQGEPECLQVLIEAGADVNKQLQGPPGRFQTALIAATHLGREDCVDLLIRNGAVVDQHVDGRFRNAMQAAMTMVGDEDAKTCEQRPRAQTMWKVARPKPLAERKTAVMGLLEKHGARREE